jgi:hypothetical protein
MAYQIHVGGFLIFPVGGVCFKDRVLYQEQKGFSYEIKTIRCDLMFNECPQLLSDSILKPSRSNHPSDEDTVITFPYVKGKKLSP